MLEGIATGEQARRRAVRTIAGATPHAWANDAFAELLRHDATLGDVVPQLGILLAFAGCLLALASWQLRRTLTA